MRRINTESRACTTKRKFWAVFAGICLLLLLRAPTIRAQQGDEQEGIEQGSYKVKQSIEFGGRVTSISGDLQTYNTFVNLHDGPRLFGFTTEMNSLNQRGTFFDRFYFNNFGYGGDPINVSSLRLSKNRWYSFSAQFRKDQNFWDYSLLANPMNPSTPIPNAPAGFNPIANAPPNVVNSPVIGTSPHTYNTRRKMGDYNLVLRPDSNVRFRLGYMRNTNEGPAFSSIHEGTDQFLFENYKTTVNTYRFGVDIRLLPRTNISYDQTWTYYKGDNGQSDNNQIFPVTATQFVDLGVPFNVSASQPCGGTFLTSGFVNPICNAFFSYFNHAPTRTSTPTEQLSIQSNYWKDWDVSARLTYSSGDTDANYNQANFGRTAKSNLRNEVTTGPVHGRRVAAGADLGATWHITNNLSFVDTFRYFNWHNPVQFDASTCSFFSPNLTTSANFFSPSTPPFITCAPPADAIAGSPVHNSSSAPDLTLILNSNFLKQDEKSNLAELDYRFNEKVGARIGFRYRHRFFADNSYTTAEKLFYPGPTATDAARKDCARLDSAAPVSPANLPPGCTLNADSSITFVSTPAFEPPSEIVPAIAEYSGLFGFWAKPAQNWIIRFDMELMSADGSFTRVSPTHSQEYRIRSKYKIKDWLSLNGNILILEGRNNEFQQGDLNHNRAYGVSALVQPNEKLALEIGYDYNDVFSQILICYTSTANGQPGPGTQACPSVSGLVQQLSTYTNLSHYGYFDFLFTPVHRFTVRLGANLTGTSGDQLRLDPQALIPSAVNGSLNSKWLHPFGGFEYHFAKQWTGKAYWDYYGYHEDPTAGAEQDIFAPRNFRGNLVTLSLRYAF
jgi:hypothetical protein